MTADPLILQIKYTDIVKTFAQKAKISFDKALAFFYHSAEYQLLKDGISDLHCMTPEYIAEDLMEQAFPNAADA